MPDPINLNRFRKEKARREARATADANAAKFGRTKAERMAEEARGAQAAARLDGHRRGPQIRAAAPADAAAVAALIRETLRRVNGPDYAPAIIARIIAGFDDAAVAAQIASRLVLVAEAGGALRGTGGLFLRADGVAEIRSLFVTPDSARQGIGRALVARLGDEARASGATRLAVQSALTARGFYERLGFVALREERIADEPVLWMDRAP